MITGSFLSSVPDLMEWGLRGSAQSRWGRVDATFTAGERLNMFFYHVTWCGPTAYRLDVLDARNTTLEVRITPRVP